MRPDDLAACAALVERADPDRFRAAMAAPAPRRRMLFPIYAFNVEVSRAPWVTSEPMIAQMRLQWWRDALSEIASGTDVRRHEVVTPLAEVLGPAEAALLDDLVAARSWDIHSDPFESREALLRYLDRTSGHLICAVAGALEGGDEAVLRDYALASGLANWLLAVPALKARNRRPLPDESPAAIAALAREGLARLARARQQRERLPVASRAALLPGWRSGYVLRAAAQEPGRVAAGHLRPSPARSRMLLIWQATTGRF